MKVVTCLPEVVVTNEQLESDLGKWTSEELFQKTGIKKRHVLAENQNISDIMLDASNLLFESYDRKKIDFVIVCTEAPDYSLPATSCIIQDKLGLSQSVGAFDINLGCSGYIYGLGICKSLIESRLASNILLLTGDAYTKMVSKSDFVTRPIFGDAATATVVEEEDVKKLKHFVFGTDGGGADQLKCSLGGFKHLGRSFEENKLTMNGPEIFNFTMKIVPQLVESVLHKAGLGLEDIDKVIFHQANGFMLESLRRKIKIPSSKFVLDFEETGNTVSSTIPICLSNIMRKENGLCGQKILLVAFGVGLSWSGCLLEL